MESFWEHSGDTFGIAPCSAVEIMTSFEHAFCFSFEVSVVDWVSELDRMLSGSGIGLAVPGKMTTFLKPCLLIVQFDYTRHYIKIKIKCLHTSGLGPCWLMLLIRSSKLSLYVSTWGTCALTSGVYAANLISYRQQLKILHTLSLWNYNSDKWKQFCTYDWQYSKLLKYLRRITFSNFKLKKIATNIPIPPITKNGILYWESLTENSNSWLSNQDFARVSLTNFLKKKKIIGI